jgi:hypothetical protein
MNSTDPKIRADILDPARFAQNVLRQSIWSKQAQILRAVRDHPLVAVKIALWVQVKAYEMICCRMTQRETAQVITEMGRGLRPGRLEGVEYSPDYKVTHQAVQLAFPEGPANAKSELRFESTGLPPRPRWQVCLHVMHLKTSSAVRASPTLTASD